LLLEPWADHKTCPHLKQVPLHLGKRQAGWDWGLVEVRSVLI